MPASPHRPRLRRRLGVVLLVGLAAVAVASYAATRHRAPAPPMTTLDVETTDWHDRRHHDGASGFRNVWDRERDASGFRTFKWVVGHAFQRKENRPPPARTIDPAGLRTAPERLRITWVGHSTTLIQTPRLNILTDPMFSERASPVGFAGPEREVPLPLDVADLPAVDVVLISHDHYDHLDEASVRALAERFDPLFLVPLGLGALVKGWGATRVTELDWWQYVDVDGVRYYCTPAQHFSGRGLFDRDATLWASWYVQAGDLRLYYGGDSGYAGHFTDIRERLGAPEIALLPIGAYRPRWLMDVVHVDPEEAVQAFLDLQAEQFVPVHWGTFDLADEPLQEAPDLARAAAEAAGVAGRLNLLAIGGTVEF